MKKHMKRAWKSFSTWKWPLVDEPIRLDPSTPISDDQVRFVCLSDTHGRADHIANSVPDGDVLLHTGDFTTRGFAEEVDVFNRFLGRLPHKYKVVIAGNHELSFDDDMVRNSRETLNGKGLTKDRLEDFLEHRNMNSVKDLMTNCIYLEDTMVDVFGIKIYGAPWSHEKRPIPHFVNSWLPAKNMWAFNAASGNGAAAKWNRIPDNVDILMTHGPPFGHGDRYFFECYGCTELLNTVQRRVRPAYHIFGHTHEGYGVTTDGNTIYINAANCDLANRLINPPIVFDMPLPDGRSKEAFLDSEPMFSKEVTTSLLGI